MAEGGFFEVYSQKGICVVSKSLCTVSINWSLICFVAMQLKPIQHTAHLLIPRNIEREFR